MKSVTGTVLVLAALMVAGTVRADTFSIDTVASAPAGIATAPVSVQLGPGSVEDLVVSGQAVDLGDAGHPITADSAQIRTAPPAPSSVSLLLLGLGTLGVFQVGRSIKSVDLAHVPDWFHAGAPDQIGHVVILDLDRNDLPLCAVEAPVAEPTYSYRIDHPSLPRGEPQWLAPVWAPRGPPEILC